MADEKPLFLEISPRGSGKTTRLVDQILNPPQAIGLQPE